MKQDVIILKLQEILKLKKDTMSVPALRKLLGLGKTDSYWLIHQGHFESIQINGRYYIKIDSFEKWYENQAKYKKVDGTPPGKKLSETSYSVRDVASMLEVDDETIYVRIRDGVLETYLAEGWMRITKESFQKWYGSQCKLRTEADKMLDSDAENSSISLTDAARALGTHRNNIYDLIKRHPTEFQIITVAGRKRITRESFERWYNSQSRYRLKPCMESSQSSEPSGIEIETSKAVEDESAVGNQEVQQEDERPFYTFEEIQLRMNLSKKEAYDLAQTGLFKVIRVGKRYFIPKDSFEEWLSISQIQKEEQ